MSIWLKALGARVVGFSLDPPTVPNLFQEASLEGRVVHIHGDVRDLDALVDVMVRHTPEFAFHLAAQSLVRLSYDEPLETYGTNIMGTAHFLEAVRACPSLRVCQVITSDKCYENRETGHAYTEGDHLGGFDPYSSSKAGAELVTAAYRRSFLRERAAVSTVRAGNIIGGGDWAADRLIPDCIRALSSEGVIRLRNPGAVRPWQYVLEPISGYLHLASLMALDPPKFSGAWNFGPSIEDCVTVGDLVEKVVTLWGRGAWEAAGSGEEPHEAGLLRLDTTKAEKELGWQPVWRLDEGLARTVAWYKTRGDDPGRDLFGACLEQIEAYAAAAAAAGAPWAGGGTA